MEYRTMEQDCSEYNWDNDTWSECYEEFSFDQCATNQVYGKKVENGITNWDYVNEDFLERYFEFTNSTQTIGTDSWVVGSNETWFLREANYDFWAENNCYTVCSTDGECVKECDGFDLYFEVCDNNVNVKQVTDNEYDCSEYFANNDTWSNCTVTFKVDACNLDGSYCEETVHVGDYSKYNTRQGSNCKPIMDQWYLMRNSTGCFDTFCDSWKMDTWGQSYFDNCLNWDGCNDWEDENWDDVDASDAWESYWEQDDMSDMGAENGCWEECYENNCTLSCDWGNVTYEEYPVCDYGSNWNYLVLDCAPFGINFTECYLYYNYDQCNLTDNSCFFRGFDDNMNYMSESCNQTEEEWNAAGPEWDFLNPYGSDNGWEDWWSNEDEYDKEHSYVEGEQVCDADYLVCEYVDCYDEEIIGDLGCWKELCDCVDSYGDDTCDLWHYDYSTEEWDMQPCWNGEGNAVADDCWIDEQGQEQCCWWENDEKYVCSYDDGNFVDELWSGLDDAQEELEEVAEFASGFNRTSDYVMRQGENAQNLALNEMDGFCENFTCVTNATADFINNGDVSGKIDAYIGASQEGKEVLALMIQDIQDNSDDDMDFAALQVLFSIEDSAELQEMADMTLKSLENENDGLVAGFLGAFREGLENLGSTRRGSRDAWGGN